MDAIQYPGFDEHLLRTARENLLSLGFHYAGEVLRGVLFVSASSGQAVMLDHRICDDAFPYSYSEYTKEQNGLMHAHTAIYRFCADDQPDLHQAVEQLRRFLAQDFDEGMVRTAGPDRQLREVDPTLPEAHFEQVFIDTYGREEFDKVIREYPVIDIFGHTRWVDYYIARDEFDIAVEKNGETYHHPIIVGKGRYNRQLTKQNSLSAYGVKTFRWSLQAMQFRDNFSEELKVFFGDAKRFRLGQKVSVSRSFSYFEHQQDTLKAIQEARAQGENTFLVVLPTGTGKTEILISDVVEQYRGGNAANTLVMVPSRVLRDDHIKKINDRLLDLGAPPALHAGEDIDQPVVVKTYSWMSRNYRHFDTHRFDYIAVDEAHHAVAPTVKKVIQHFTPNTLLGLTATDQRLDQKSLEDIFGKYEVNLSLRDAIEQGLLAPIKAFRARSNIDLSEVRFNGKDYYRCRAVA